MRTLEELDLVPVWVNPDHLLATAIHVMQGHKINAVAVVGFTGLQGMVTLERANLMPKMAKVETIVQAVPLSIDIETSVRDAAKRFVEDDTNYAAVYRDSEFRGLLTANMLLREIGQSWDPLTNLPWSNRLRDWGASELSSGGEVTIAFVDIDDFGNYNKKHGHIVGDNILKLLSAHLRDIVDRHSDVLVRYGGDEFVIGTKLERADAEERFGGLMEVNFAVDEVPEPVTVSVGFAGGMRLNTREHAHIASMLDDLINLASQDCTASKDIKLSAARDQQDGAQHTPVEGPGEPELPEPGTVERTYDVRLVSLDEDDPAGPVAVTLRIDDKDGTFAEMPDGRSLVLTVANATAHAIERIVPSVRLTISTTVVDSAPDGSRTVTVVGSCESQGRTLAMAGTAPVNRDVNRAVAEAVATAFVSLGV